MKCIFSLLLAVLLLASPLMAGTTLPGSLFMQEGSGLGRTNGDYVSNASTGLNAPYRYYIEVPPSSANLTVEVFDTDIGGGTDESAGTGAPGNRDRFFGGSYNSQVTYRLINPLGTTVQTLTRNNTNGVDNDWEVIGSINSPLNGHWLLEVDMSSSVTTGDDINGIGVRAHDGNPGSTGVEMNIYAESYIILGTHALPGDIALFYYFYPYVTSGCECYYRDFDTDDNVANTDSWIDLQSRNAAFNPAAINYISNNNIWGTQTFSGFADDGGPGVGLLSDGYGLWPSEFRVDGVTTTGSNYIGYYVAAFNAPGAPFTGGGVSFEPSGQPTSDSFRIYLPRDGSSLATPQAPLKPYLRQYQFDNVSGPNPALNGQTTTIRLRVEMVNPTPHAITFSPTNVVTVNVPSVRVQYVNPGATVSQGTILTQPANNGNGNITWNPGVLAAGATATLEYLIRVTPTANAQTTNLTGTPAVSGTTARFVDGTGNTVQSRATYTFGPICQLSLVSGAGGSVLSVDLMSFETEILPDGTVKLVWTTLNEVENAGFEIYSVTTSGDVAVEDELLTPQPIPSIGSSGGKYEFIDKRALAQKNSLDRGYYLVDIDFAGVRTYHGPYYVNVASLLLSSSVQNWAIFE